MKVETTYYFNSQPEQVWPLLLNSNMDSKHPCFLLFGLPKPVRCELDQGGVGNKRRCVSDKGLVQQNILVWEPNKKLVFEMEDTTIYFKPYIESIVETFTLEKVRGEKLKVTRTTVFELSKDKVLLSIPMWIGLKSIHRYVFKNWVQLSKKPHSKI